MNDSRKAKLEKILSKAGDISFRRRVVKVLEYLDIRDGDIVLDCGCGEGFYTMVIRELYGDICTVISLDMDFELVKRARGWQREDSPSRFVIGDVTRLPFWDGMFDKVIFSEVLEHVEDDAGALREVRRVLKKGGVVALTVPNHNYPFWWDPCNKIRERLGMGHFSADNGFWGGLWAMHLRLYYKTDLVELVRAAGYDIVEEDMVTHYCLPFNHMILYAGKRMGNVIPLPQSVAKSMEKFDWKESQAGVFPRLIRGAMKFVDMIDRRNDAVEGVFSVSSVCIGMKLYKS